METNPDLKDDLFRDYYQNTQGDREKLKQDFTPGCLGQVISEMAGRAKSIADICAGTGTLTIKNVAEKHRCILPCRRNGKERNTVVVGKFGNKEYGCGSDYEKRTLTSINKQEQKAVSEYESV